jgi:uncharacterized protein (DUF2141 family)
MKSVIAKVYTIAMLFTTPLTSAKTLEFKIEGIKSSKGKIYVQLFKGEESYQNNTAYLSSIAKAKQGQVTITFNDLDLENIDNAPLNDYGIRYYHDENDNASMETNLFGMPLEGYGYSNNAKANYGPVDYSQIKFHMTNETQVNTSTIVY